MRIILQDHKQLTLGIFASLTVAQEAMQDHFERTIADHTKYRQVFSGETNKYSVQRDNFGYFHKADVNLVNAVAKYSLQYTS